MIDELLAKLEAGTVSFEPRGGTPALTASEIAAALGLCENRFAATIYQAIAYNGYLHWPEIDRMLAEFQFAEWRERADRMVNAQLALASAQITTEDRKFLTNRARQMLAGATAAMWPPLYEDHYAGMRKALIHELRERRVCHACGGRRFVQRDKLVVDCLKCAGTGRIAISSSQRSEACGIPERTYLRVWKRVYEWMYFRLLEVCREGREQFEAALGRRVA